MLFNGIVQWPLVNPLEYTAFVTGTPTPLAVGDLVVTQITAEDGAQFTSTALVNVASGEQCAPVQRADGSVRCALQSQEAHASRDLSKNGVPSKIFADASCTTPAALAEATETPLFVTDVTPVPCGEALTDEYEIGAEVPAGWALTEGVCAPQPGWRYYLVGAKRPSRDVWLGTWERGAG